MSTVPSYFKDFLSNIRLSDNQVSDLKTGHTTLRKRLEADETLSKIIVSTFLQGSYRRSTAVKPKNGNKSDVDVIVVTKLDSEEYTPEEALDLFVPFLDKYYNGKYRIQGRSIGISLSYVDLDIVPTSAPSESETSIAALVLVEPVCNCFSGIALRQKSVEKVPRLFCGERLGLQGQTETGMLSESWM